MLLRLPISYTKLLRQPIPTDFVREGTLVTIYLDHINLDSKVVFEWTVSWHPIRDISVLGEGV